MLVYKLNQTTTDEDKSLREIEKASKSNAELENNYINQLNDDKKLSSMLSTQGRAFLATGALKSTTTNSDSSLVKNRAFEWIRGAAMSGWVFLWPKSSEKIGFAVKRYLVLRDNILAYYENPPTDIMLSG